MRFAAFLMSVVLSGCGVNRLERIDPSIDVQPAVIDFGIVYAGELELREFNVTNRTNAPVEVTISTEAPFAAATSLALAGGESRALSVELIAPNEGPIEAALTLEPGGATVILRAQAKLREGCGVAAACQTFNADCSPVVSPDGTACTSACLSASTCVAGSCVGTPVDCDDRDPCTDDSCGEAGCVHTAIACAAPVDGCKAARCDPQLGCVTGDVADGTSCGPNDCSTARVCISGSCVARPAPDGSICAPAAGCREASSCVAGACVAGRARPLLPAWKFPLQGGVANDGLRADEAGNLFFMERTGSSPGLRWLVSLDSRGQLRFRVLSALTQFDSPYFLVSAGVVVVASASHRATHQQLLEARSATDGALLWKTEFETLFPVPSPILCSATPHTWIGADAAGHLFVRSTMHSGCAEVGVGFAALDLQTGAVISRRQTAPWTAANPQRSAVVDSQGRWVYVEPDGSSLAAWDLAGVQAWNTNPRSGPIAATPGGRLITGDGTVLHPMGGAVGGTALSTQYPRGGALTGRLERAFFLTHPSGTQVEKFDLLTASSLWRRAMPDSGLTPFGFFGVLTARDSVVFSATSPSSPDAELVEVSWEGDERIRCPLRSGTTGYTIVRPLGQAVLLQGRWVTWDAYQRAVVAFDVDGLAPAEHGWVTPQGTQGGEQRPLP